jgi:hypothetical protein
VALGETRLDVIQYKNIKQTKQKSTDKMAVLIKRKRHIAIENLPVMMAAP